MSALPNSAGSSKVAASGYAGSGSPYIYAGPQVPRPLSLQSRNREAKALPNLSIPRHGSGIRLDNRSLTIILRYPINLFWSESDGAWFGDVPDLQSCSA